LTQSNQRALLVCTSLKSDCTAAIQVPCNPSINLTGGVTVNGIPASESNHRQAYVQQEDVFYSMLTVKEVRGSTQC